MVLTEAMDWDFEVVKRGELSRSRKVFKSC